MDKISKEMNSKMTNVSEPISLLTTMYYVIHIGVYIHINKPKIFSLNLNGKSLLRMHGILKDCVFYFVLLQKSDRKCSFYVVWEFGFRIFLFDF